MISVLRKQVIKEGRYPASQLAVLTTSTHPQKEMDSVS